MGGPLAPREELLPLQERSFGQRYMNRAVGRARLGGDSHLGGAIFRRLNQDARQFAEATGEPSLPNIVFRSAMAKNTVPAKAHFSSVVRHRPPDFVRGVVTGI